MISASLDMLNAGIGSEGEVMAQVNLQYNLSTVARGIWDKGHVGIFMYYAIVIESL